MTNIREALTKAAIEFTDEKKLIKALLDRIEKLERVVWLILTRKEPTNYNHRDLKPLDHLKENNEPEYSCNDCDQRKTCAFYYFLEWDNMPACVYIENRMKQNERMKKLGY